ncbi:hypothetical protein D9758_003374 [Tetrapyrgos nigripes]|uniref:F-box domain-containing protein n=1 Tax=Tetrapyrgos nigripes TaxID=182062 RepID=A0A8H5LW84_9AGAR|nr:hypothetical protein D9758_003374 [Tetrapyrgos nigripes]
MPVELWEGVFLLSLPDFGGLQISHDEINAPSLDLSHVCSFWRAVTISTPTSWTSLDINLESCSSTMPDIVSLYFHRSGDSPLQLKLSALDEDGDGVLELEYKSKGWDILGMLLEASSRWSHLRLDLTWDILDSDDVQELIGKKAYQCEVLQSFDVDFGGQTLGGDDGSPHFFQLLETTPHLHSVYLGTFREMFLIPFSQLREITVSSFESIREVLECLYMCSNLQKADITVWCFGDDVGIRELCLPNLHSLRVNLFRSYL